MADAPTAPAKPDVIDALAAVALVLDREYPYYSCRNVLGAVDVDALLVDAPYRWVVLARTHEEEWSLFTVRPAAEEPADASNLEHAAGDLVVRVDTNALSHAHGLLELLGLSTGIL